MGKKLKLILSDLHLGAGYVQNKCSLLEDFTATEALTSFLHRAAHESEVDQKEIELMINGDLFEFLQVPAVDKFDPTVSYAKELYQDSSQAASIKRLNIISQGHEDVFNALSDFMHVEKPQRRITIIKGNHDINLFWPGVKSRLREILGATGTRASLLRFADEFVSRENIYVEHGHQLAEKMNGYQDSFDPRSYDDPNQLYYPTGSRFVIDFFNEVEQDWWFVDHIKPITTLIWYAFHWNFELASRALISFIRHTPALAVNNFAFTGQFAPYNSNLVDKLENPKKRQEIAQRYAVDPQFRQDFHHQIQQYLDDAHIDNRGTTSLPPFQVSHNPLEMGQASQKHQQALLRQAAQKIAAREGAKVIVFGHTHYPVREVLNNGSLYINTGSWIEDFSDATPETWEALFKGVRQPRPAPTKLTYARIDYDDRGTPSAQLLYFDPQTKTAGPVSEESAPASPDTGHFFFKNFNWISRLLGDTN